MKDVSGLTILGASLGLSQQVARPGPGCGLCPLPGPKPEGGGLGTFAQSSTRQASLLGNYFFFINDLLRNNFDYLRKI